MRKLVIGILAHVDAGKTTLSEGMLYTCGTLKRLGRVDHQDAFLDTEALERERGITIFSKQAVLPLSGVEVTLLDTPGHVDFSSEMERTLQVLDCAILVISGTDGVQGHTRTLWRLLERYHIPTLLFVNKMDRASKDPFALMEELENVLGIRSCPMNWPIGVDGDFQGVYQRNTGHVLLYSGGNHGMSMADELSVPLDSPEAEKALEKHYRDRLRDEIELLDEAGDPFDKEAVLSGKLTPLFFGSAVTNFGVEPCFEAFFGIKPPPNPPEADIGIVVATPPKIIGLNF